MKISWFTQASKPELTLSIYRLPDEPEPFSRGTPGVRPNHSVAVIFPLHDNRGFGLQALRAWQQQRLRKQLSAPDSLVNCRTLNEAKLYNAGAAVATADWLLFSESHVVPAKNMLSRLTERLKDETVDAAVLGSAHETRGRFSQVDAALCEREHAGPMRAVGLWRCVGLRGFLVRRRVFEQLGCFVERYYRFAETAFALRLVAANYHLSHFQDVVVRHIDSDSVGEIFFAMKMGRLGACRFHEMEPELAAAGFGCSSPPLSPSSTSPLQARRLWHQTFRHLRAGRFSAAWQFVQLALPVAPSAVGGWWFERLVASARAHVAHAVFRGMLHGSYSRRPATDSDAVIQLDIRPTGHLTPRKPQFFLDGRALPSEAIVERNGRLEILLGDADASGGRVLLSWVCRSFRPARAGLADHRELGVALIAATVTAIVRQTAHVPERVAA
ncbi:MAG: hypothetical protein EBS83_09565 [Planctomycetia bacterium]|nr:hypothetical protein [Planctomycetia bacterium]